MNKNMRTHLYSLLILLLTVGCSEELIIPSPSPEGGNIELPGGRVAFAIHTMSPMFQRPVTRIGAAAENQIDGNVWVFVFDASTADHLFLEAVKATGHQITSTTGQSRRTVNLKVRNHKVTLLVLANAPSKIHNGTAEVTLTEDPASWGLTTATTLADARSLLRTVPLASPAVSQVPYTPSLPIPMSAEVSYDKLDASVNIGTESAPLPLLRVVAKLNVKKDFVSTGTSATPNFTLKGATVYNTPRNASLFPVHKSNATNCTDYIGTGAAGSEIIGIAPAVNDSTMMNPIYLYPSAETNVEHQPFVLIQARYANDVEDTYYKLAIAPIGKPRGQVDRNANYRLLIKECTGRGYATIADAIAAPSSKLIYTVEVIDLSSHDLLDNGQYYIGLSNSEYHFYAQNSFVNLPVATLHTGNNFGAEVFKGNVTITSSDPNNLIVQTPSFTHPASSGETILAAVTKDFTEGFLTVRLGNLTKQIKVVRKSNSFITIKDELIVNDTYKDAKYKVASVVNPKNWIKLGTSSTVTLATGQDLVASDAGGVYIAYNANMAKPDLENFVYVSRSDSSGRIKAHFLLAPLVFVNTDGPNLIDRDAKRLGGSGTGSYNFYFSNPSSYDYKVGLFFDGGNPTVNAKIESSFNNATDKTLQYSPLKEDKKDLLPRMFVAKVQVGGYWYEIDYYVQQRYELAINILTVGRNGIDYHKDQTGQFQYGTKLGRCTGNIEKTYNDGLGILLYTQTGPGKPIDIPIKMYHLCNNNSSNAGTANYDYSEQDYVLNVLKDKNIDILVCFVHGQAYNGVHGPSEGQAKDIIDEWLMKNKYRGLIYTCDWIDDKDKDTGANSGWSKAIFKTNQGYYGYKRKLERLPDGDVFYNHPVYRSIMSGSYSKYENYPSASTGTVLYGSDQDITFPKEDTIMSEVRTYVRNRDLDPTKGLRDTKITFYTPQTYGFIPLALMKEKGFIPLLYHGSSQDVTLAVHPTMRIVFQGELQYYQVGYGLNADGSLVATKYGPYPKMMMNLWEWFFNNVALGKKY